MMNSRRYNVLLSFYGGRDFEAKPGYGLFAEATLAGIRRPTNNYPLWESPEINDELKWELSGKEISDMKSNRIYMKVNFYSSKVKKDQIGYVMLDLRMMSTESIKPRWYSLLSSKSRKYEPAIRMSLSCQQLRNDDASTTLPSSDHLNRHNIYAVYQEKDGYFFIGPKSKAKLEFELAFTLLSIANLKNLLNSTASSNNDELHVIYSLLAQNACSNPLKLDSNDFAQISDRVAISLRTNATSFRDFLAYNSKQATGIGKITLAQGTQAIGEVNLFVEPELFENLMSDVRKDKKSKCLVKEDDYSFHSVDRKKQLRNFNASAKVSIELIFLKEIEGAKLEVKKSGAETKKDDLKKIKDVVSLSNYHFEVEFKCLCLKSVLEELDCGSVLFLRYSYPFLGVKEPIQTESPIEINEPETILNNCSSAFEFAADPSELKSRFASEKLVVEILRRSKDKNRLIAICPIDLSVVFNGVETTNEDGYIIHDNVENFYLTGSQNEDFIRVRLYLMNRGTIGQLSGLSFATDGTFQMDGTFVSKEKLMREKEAKRLLELTTAFSEKQIQLESQLKKKIQEVEKLKRELEERQANIQQREFELDAKETEMRCRQEALDARMSNKVHLMEENKKGLIARINDAEQRNRVEEQRIQKEIDLEKEKGERLDLEYGKLMCSLSELDSEEQTTLHRLRKEIYSTESENVQLERDLSTFVKSADEYKNMWIKAISDIALSKEDELKLMKQTVQNQAMEIEEITKKFKGDCSAKKRTSC